MNKFNLKDLIINIFFNSIGISLSFGWIVLIILFALFDKEPAYIPFIIYLMIILIISFCIEYKNKINEVDNEKQRLNKIYREEQEKLKNKINEVDNYYLNKKNYADNYFNLKKNEFQKIINDEKLYKPYLAKIYADYEELLDNEIEHELRYKSRPALKAADEISEIKKEKRMLNNKLKKLEYQNYIYEYAFLWLEEFKEIDEYEMEQILNITSDDEYERAKNYLSPDEYKNLPEKEKYQLWLTRYKNKKNKTKWEIGRDFERFVGYKYEMLGYKLVYNGALEGLDDFGRDLIATKKNEILVIQCKYWSQEKTIHEKHIFQLYGTMILKQLEDKNKKVKGIFVCTNELSPIAKKVAEELKIEVIERYHYDKNYPCIKCNISKEDGTKIYHLPFDQQYDRINIEIAKGECYVSTIEEAEKLGFRKAKKYFGNKQF